LVEDIGTGPVGTTLLEERLVVYHDGERYVALRDLCSHRGTRLSLGTLTEEGQIRCPYHGWTYESGGRCVYIPAQPRDHQRIPRAAVVPSYEVIERYGLVWVALDDPVAPIPAYPEFDSPEMRTILVGHWSWAASAGRFLENTIDTAHLPIVHPGLLGDPEETAVDPPRMTKREDVLFYATRRREPATSHYDKPGSLVSREAWVVYPFSWRMRISTSRGTMVLFVIAQPRSERTCSFWVYCSRDYRLSPPDDRTFDDEIREVNALIVEQDRVMVESQQPEALPLDLTEEVHLRVADAACIEYRRRLRLIAGAAYG
jgi:vanillate O-demethylase monooxygenase subunit